MPYIKQERRSVIDEEIYNLIERMQDLLGGPCGGDLNYVFSQLALGMKAKNYKEFSEIIATFECAKLEYYRRQMQDYEDLKAKENGDLAGFAKK